MQTSHSSVSSAPAGSCSSSVFGTSRRRRQRPRVAERPPVRVLTRLRVGRPIGEEEGHADQRPDPRGRVGGGERDVAKDLLARELGGDPPQPLLAERAQQLDQARADGLVGDLGDQLGGGHVDPEVAGAVRAQKPSGSRSRSIAGTTVSQTARSTARSESLSSCSLTSVPSRCQGLYPPARVGNGLLASRPVAAAAATSTRPSPTGSAAAAALPTRAGGPVAAAVGVGGQRRARGGRNRPCRRASTRQLRPRGRERGGRRRRTGRGPG